MTAAVRRGLRPARTRSQRLVLGLATTSLIGSAAWSWIPPAASAAPAGSPTPTTRPAAAAPPGSAARPAAEVVEKHDDGSARARYGVDADKRRHGTYEEFFKTGKLRVRGGYTAGQKSGGWLTYDEAGKLKESAAFDRNGVQEGPYAWYAPDGKASYKATFRQGGFAGAVTVSDEKGKPVRVANYPRAIGEIRQNWAALYPKALIEPKFLEPFSGAPPYKPGKIAQENLDQALRLAKLYRYLSGVPWQHLSLNPAATLKAQHGAVLLTKIGSLTHTPSKPDDMDEAFFKLAYAGCNESNLHMGQAHITDGVRGFMDDSDPSNIAGMGHRRWVLKPGLKRVGFGFAGGFAAMHIIDKSDDVPAYQYVAFPGEGYYPRLMVEPHFAWSVHFHPSRMKVPDAGELKARIVRLDERFQPTGEVPAEVVSVIREERQGWNVVVFKPEFKSVEVGKYWVDIAGLKAARGNAVPFGYMVELVEMEGGVDMSLAAWRKAAMDAHIRAATQPSR